jgi:hypothetical protein
MGAPSRHPTRSEIIEQAALEGHDADIPSDIGSLRQVPSTNSADTRAPKNTTQASTLPTDVEKGNPDAQTRDEEVDVRNGEEEDANIVFWDGPNDPENPMNWSPMKRWGTVAIVSALTFLTPLASSNFAPGVPQVMKAFHSDNDMLSGFMVSVYVLGFAFGPMSRSCSMLMGEGWLMCG